MYFPVSVAEAAPDALGSTAEPVGGRVVLVNGKLYAFRRSVGEMSLSSAQSASVAEDFAVVMGIFGTFKVGIGLEVCGIGGGFAGLVIMVAVVLARFVFFALVVVELLPVVELPKDGDLRFK